MAIVAPSMPVSASRRSDWAARFLNVGDVDLETLAMGESIPPNSSAIVVSNHRSLLDPLVLMAALGRDLRVVCHPFMARVPGLRQVAVDGLGCLPLGNGARRAVRLQKDVGALLARGEWLGIFPEGARPMVTFSPRDRLCPFARGFAHLALAAPVPTVILPVALISRAEWVAYPFPVRWLRAFDRAEPCFQQPGWHPVVVYRHVTVAMGQPYWVDASLQAQYRGRQAGALARQIADDTQAELARLLAAHAAATV